MTVEGIGTVETVETVEIVEDIEIEYDAAAPVSAPRAAEQPADQLAQPLADHVVHPSGEPLAPSLGSGPGEHDHRHHSRQLFAQLNDPDTADRDRQAIRDELVEIHLPLVEHLARRFRNRGEPFDDLVQVGTIGLIKAVDRFDTARGVEFSTYATPTIVGEIKRHFRDKGWAVRVPRRLQELRLSLSAATAQLAQDNGRAPTVAELASHLGISEDEVLEGLESSNAYSTLSLEAGESDNEESQAFVDTLGVDDEALEGIEYRESLKPLIAALAPRERLILSLRFFGNLTQSQIAAEIGISQMHVSRLLARTLAQLRDGLLGDQQAADEGEGTERTHAGPTPPGLAS